MLYSISRRAGTALTAISGTITALLFLGFQIGSLDSMPNYAVVMADDSAKTYLAPQCVQPWQKKNDGFGILRRTTAEEVTKIGYHPDRDCVETGAFAQDGNTLTGLLLVKLGLLQKPHHWWDDPYRTEEGIVRPPNTKPDKTPSP